MASALGLLGGLGTGLMQGVNSFNEGRKINLSEDKEAREALAAKQGLLLKAKEGGFALGDDGSINETDYTRRKRDLEMNLLKNQALLSNAKTKMETDALGYLGGGKSAAPTSVAPVKAGGFIGQPGAAPQPVAPQTLPPVPMRNPDASAATPQDTTVFGLPAPARGGFMDYATGGFLTPASIPQGKGEGGPTREDEALEGKIRSGEEIERPANEQGLGVDSKRLRALQMAGVLTGTAAEKASEEHGKYMKLQKEVDEANRVFDIASRNATFRGRVSRNLTPEVVGEKGSSFVSDITRPLLAASSNFAALGDESTKAYKAAVDPFVDKLAKDVAGRVTPISFEKLSSTMPEQGDSDRVLSVKRQKLMELIKSSYSFPHLLENGLVDANDPLLNTVVKKGLIRK